MPYKRNEMSNFNTQSLSSLTTKQYSELQMTFEFEMGTLISYIKLKTLLLRCMPYRKISEQEKMLAHDRKLMPLMTIICSVHLKIRLQT